MNQPLQTGMQNAFAKAHAQAKAPMGQGEQVYNAVRNVPKRTPREYSDATKINYSTLCNILSYGKAAGFFKCSEGAPSGKNGTSPKVWEVIGPWDMEEYQEGQKKVKAEWPTKRSRWKAKEPKIEVIGGMKISGDPKERIEAATLKAVGETFVLGLGRNAIEDSTEECKLADSLRNKIDVGQLPLAEAHYLYRQLKKIFKD